MPDVVTDLRAALDDLQRDHPRAEGHVLRLKTLVTQVEIQLAAYRAPKINYTRPGRTLENYKVERWSKNSRELVLTEMRPESRSRPHRCPRPLYDATVKVLSSETKAIDFDDLLAGVRMKVPDFDVGKHQVRTALRFLQLGTKPLVLRERALYQASNPARIRAEAAKLWVKIQTATYH